MEARDDDNSLLLDPVEVTHVEFFDTRASQLRAEGGWLPVYLEFKCQSDRAQTVTVEATVDPGDKGPPFVTVSRFEVAPGAPKRAWVYLRAQPRGEDQRASLVVKLGERILRIGDRWPINSYENTLQISPAILVAGGHQNDQRLWFGEIGEDISADLLEWVETHQLPDRSLGYQSFDIVVLRGLDEKNLEPSQIEALRNFVFLGGFVVLIPAKEGGRKMYEGELVGELLGEHMARKAGSPTIEVTPAFRPRNLYYRPRLWTGDVFSESPATQGRRRTSIRTTFERAYAVEKDLDLTKGQTYTRVDPFASAEGLVRDIRSHDKAEVGDPGIIHASDLLYGEVRYGMGRVGVFTIDEQTFAYKDGAELRHALWEKVIQPAVSPSSSRWQKNAASFVRPVLVNSLKDSKREFGGFLIGSMVVGYLLLIGPGIYFFLRRKNRLPAIIWVEPLVIMLSLATIFSLGYLTKGLLTKVRLVTLFHQEEGSGVSLRESYLSIFSADDIDYAISAVRGELLNPVYANAGERQEISLARRSQGADGSRNGGTLEISEYHLSLWQQAHLLNVGVESSGQGVVVERIGGSPGEADSGDVEFDDEASRVRERLHQKQPKYRITNHLPFAIRSGGIVHEGRERALPAEIPSGGSLVVDFSVEPSANVNVTEEDRDDAEAEDPSRKMHDMRAQGMGLTGRPGLGFRCDLLFWGLLDRDVDDFSLDRPFSLADRKDYFLLYRS